MELKNEKNIVTAEKYLYAMQLKYFHEMLKTRDNPDLYERNATRLAELKKASEALSETYSYSKQKNNSTFRLNKSKVREFNKFMDSESSFLSYVNTNIKTECPFMLAHTAFTMTKKQVKELRHLDPSLVPSKIDASLSPAAFGAQINGYTTLDQVIINSIDIDTPEERRQAEKMNKIPPVIRNAVAAPGTAVNAVKHKLTGKKSVLDKVKQRALSLILVAGITVGSIAGINGIAHKISDMHERNQTFNQLSYTENYKNGFETNISMNTRSKLDTIESLLDGYDNGEIPSYEELRTLTENMDNTIDDVVTDLVTAAYKEQHPDYEVLEVETSYDDTVNMYKSASSEPSSDRFIEITYKDGKGEKHTTVVGNQEFSTYFGVENPLSRSFDDEHKIDQELYGRIYRAYNSGKIPKERDAEVRAILSEVREIYDNTSQLAGTELEFGKQFIFGDNTVKVVLPDKNNDSHDIDDR